MEPHGAEQGGAGEVDLFLVDSHAHLNGAEFDADREEVLERARARGVRLVLDIGDTPESAARAARFAESHPGVYATAGIHPHHAGEADEEAFERIWELAQHPRVVAIGEIGLDYHYDFAPREVQRAVFRRQLRMARQLGLPAVIHSREADEDLLAILAEEGIEEVGAVLHCFWSGPEVARWAVERGLYLGVGGPITFRSAEALRAVLRDVPLRHLVVETDSPYLAPVPHRGQRNEPAHVRLVAERLAELKGCSLAEVAGVTTANVARLFGIAAAEEWAARNGWL